MDDAGARAAAYQQMIDWVYLLADCKNKKVEERVASVYAQVLVGYPPALVYQAIVACAADADPWVPPVGAIVARIAERLRLEPGPRGVPAILAPGDAWKIARRTVAAYHPQTRPDPASGDPAIDAAIRKIGGIAACVWEDQIGEGIIRRAFLAAYAETSATAEHVHWALTTGGRTTLVPGKELPTSERAALLAAGAGRDLPAWLLAGVDDTRAAIVAGFAPPDPRTLALPAPGSVTLDAAQRADAFARFKDEGARLIAAWSLDRAAAARPDSAVRPVNEDDVAALATYPAADPAEAARIDAETRRRRAERQDAAAYRRQLYPS